MNLAQESLLGRVGIAEIAGDPVQVQIVGEFGSGRLAVEDIRTGEEFIVHRSAFVQPLSLGPTQKVALLTVSQATDRARAMVGDDNLLGQEDYQVLYDNLEEADRYPFAIALLENGVHVRSAARSAAVDVLTNPYDEGDPLGKAPGMPTGHPEGVASGMGADGPDQPGFAPWGPVDEPLSNPGSNSEQNMPWPRAIEGARRTTADPYDGLVWQFKANDTVVRAHVPGCQALTDNRRKGLVALVDPQEKIDEQITERFDVVLCKCVPTGWDGGPDQSEDPLEKDSEMGWSGTELVNERWAQSMSEIINSPTERPKSSVEEAQRPFLEPAGLEEIDPVHEGIEPGDAIEPIKPIAEAGKKSDLNTPSGRDPGLNPSVHEEIGQAYQSDNQWEDPDLHLGMRMAQVAVDADWYSDMSPAEQKKYKEEHPKSTKAPGGQSREPSAPKPEAPKKPKSPRLDDTDKAFLKETKVEVNKPVKLPSGRVFTLKQEKPGAPFQPDVADPEPEPAPAPAPAPATPPAPEPEPVPQTVQPPQPPSKGMGDIIDTEETSPGHFEPVGPTTPSKGTTVTQDIKSYADRMEKNLGEALKDIESFAGRLEGNAREAVNAGVNTLKSIGSFLKSAVTAPGRLTKAIATKLAAKVDGALDSILGAIGRQAAQVFEKEMRSVADWLRKFSPEVKKESSGPYETGPSLSGDESLFDEMGPDVSIQHHALLEEGRTLRQKYIDPVIRRMHQVTAQDAQVKAQSAGIAGDLHEPEPVGDGIDDPAGMDDLEEDVKEPGAFGVTVAMRQIGFYTEFGVQPDGDGYLLKTPERMRVEAQGLNWMDYRKAQGVENRVMDDNLGPDNIGESMNDLGVQRAPEDEELRYP